MSQFKHTVTSFSCAHTAAGALVSHGVSLWDQNRPRQRRNRVEVSSLGASGQYLIPFVIYITIR